MAVAKAKSDADLEREFLLRQRFTVRLTYVIGLIIDGALISIIAMMPAIFVRQMSNYQYYSILETKRYTDLNSVMEFWRYSIFSVGAYWIFLFALFLLHVAPPLIIYAAEKIQDGPALAWKRQMYFIRGVKYPIVMAFFVFGIAMLSAKVLYHSSFLETISPVVKQGDPQQILANLLERFYVFIVVFVSLYALSHYLVEIIGYYYHQTAFARRIYNVNRKYEIFEKLYRQTCPLEMQIKKEHHNAHSVLLKDNIGLASRSRTELVARTIFNKLRHHGHESIREEDLRPYFREERLCEVIGTFDTLGSGQVDEKLFIQTLVEIQEERHNLSKSLNCNQKIINKLGRVLLFLAVLMTFFAGVALFKLEKTAFVSIFGIMYLSMNFIIEQGVTELYGAINFIFVEHAYDIGDRVIVRGESLLVDHVDLYMTRFKKWDSTAVFINNNVLAGSTIYNLKRSGNASELVEVIVPAEISMDKVWGFRDKMVAFVKSHPKKFTSNLYVASIDMASPKDLRVMLIVEYFGNFQDVAHRVSRRKLLDDEISRLKEELRE